MTYYGAAESLEDAINRYNKAIEQRNNGDYKNARNNLTLAKNTFDICAGQNDSEGKKYSQLTQEALDSLGA